VRGASAGALAALVLCVGTAEAPCQTQVPALDAPPRPELRADLLGPAPYSPQLGIGLNMDAGYYARFELAAGGGGVRKDGALVGAGRVDAIVRMMLDPFAESPWGLSLGGGASARYLSGGRVRPYVTVVLDLEGPRVGDYRVACQAGLGGGARLGVIIRRARSQWR